MLTCSRRLNSVILTNSLRYSTSNIQLRHSEEHQLIPDKASEQQSPYTRPPPMNKLVI